jgi:hypothetical protein
MSQDGLEVSLEFRRRVSRMTTAEMRRCADDWRRKIESGRIPEGRRRAAKHQLACLTEQIEQRRKEEPRLPRNLRI